MDEICGAIFGCKQSLEQHVDVKQSNEPPELYFCAKRGKSFTKYRLAKHKKVHWKGDQAFSILVR